MIKIVIILILVFINKNVLSDNLFETKFYNIEFTSNNIKEEKINQINKIKSKSIFGVLQKTLNNERYNEIINDFDEDLINTFIQNIIINDEKIIDNKYFSKIKINFNKNKIINYFQNNKIPYVEYIPEKILLIIYEEDELNSNLFTKNNSYYSYLSTSSKKYDFFKVPNLDINDRYILKKKDLLNKNVKKIKIFSNKYKLNDVFIIFIKKLENNKNYEALLFSDDQILEKKLLFYKKDYNQFFEFIKKESLSIWKQINEIQNTNLNTISCNISYYNLLELKELKNNLNNISLIKNLSIKSLSYKKIEYNISYYGNLKIFTQILKLNKLNINHSDENCSIKLI
tara:strand:- start:989 stop:2014 length:1026 start_codon:yes stop_codon:yes gene_type:complete